MTESQMIPEIRRLLDLFDTKEWNPALIPGHTPTVEKDLESAVEKLETKTDKEFQNLLFASEDAVTEAEVKALFQAYLEETEKPEYKEEQAAKKAGLLMEAVLGNLNLTGAI